MPNRLNNLNLKGNQDTLLMLEPSIRTLLKRDGRSTNLNLRLPGVRSAMLLKTNVTHVISGIPSKPLKQDGRKHVDIAIMARITAI
jgi:hypothetical protein